MSKRAKILIWVLSAATVLALLAVVFFLGHKSGLRGGEKEPESNIGGITGNIAESPEESEDSQGQSAAEVQAPAEVQKPLTAEDPAAAAELVGANLVRIINKVGNQQTVGTGFFLENGFVVTNSHVVDIPGELTLVFPDGQTAETELFANDLAADIALLKTQNPGVKALSFGTTEAIRLTDPVYAAGYEFDFAGSPSVNTGTLAARRAASGKEYLQLDISMNKGFSGGPLFNARGEVLGINTFAAENGTVGIAISAESLETIVDRMLRNPNITYITSIRPYNGLSTVLTEIGYTFDDLYGESAVIREYRILQGLETEESKEPESKAEESKTQTPPPQDTRVEVPKLTGMFSREAKKLAQSRGLTVEGTFIKVPPGGWEPGWVYSQSIAPGTKVEKGTKITLYFPTDDDLISVPNVIGLSFEEAVEALIAAGFQAPEKADYIEFRYFVSQPGYAPGTVVDFICSPGTEFHAYCSEIPKHMASFGNIGIEVVQASNVTIPSLVGKPLEEAQQILLNLPLFMNGLGSQTQYEYSDTVPKGCIISYWTCFFEYSYSEGEVIMNPTELNDREYQIEAIVSLGPDPNKPAEESGQAPEPESELESQPEPESETESQPEPESQSEPELESQPERESSVPEEPAEESEEINEETSEER